MQWMNIGIRARANQGAIVGIVFVRDLSRDQCIAQPDERGGVTAVERKPGQWEKQKQSGEAG
jgi:hypothetical protein